MKVGRVVWGMTLIDRYGRAREYDMGTRHPIVLIVAGVEYVRVNARRGRVVYREVDEDDDNDVITDTAATDD